MAIILEIFKIILLDDMFCVLIECRPNVFLRFPLKLSRSRSR